MTTTTIHWSHLEKILITERARLLGLCTHLTGDPDSAEDLLQEVMLEAWRSLEKLRDPAALMAWLHGIVRNVCARWQRIRGREAAVMLHDEQIDTDTDSTLDTVADDFDMEVELERSELVTLLDRAMGLLPPEVRGLLVQHYLEELPQTELAAKVGLSNGALAVRLHRGKLALRHLLTSELSDDAIALGLITPEATGWRPTRIWCFNCGQHYWVGQFNQPQGHLRLRCPACCNPHDADDLISNSQTNYLHKFKSYKPAYSSVLKCIYDYYIENAQAGIVHCRQCKQAIPMRLGTPPGHPAWKNGIYAWCERCQIAAGTETWWSLTQSLPQFRQFWQEYPRMRAIPVRHLTIANIPAVLTCYESVTTGARIETAFSTNTFEVIYIERYK